MTFNSLGFASCLIRAIEEVGYEAPTPIQTAVIPAILSGKDVLACAQTGSGKTGAFSLPILQRWLSQTKTGSRKVHALILVPTRELAAQVAQVLRRYATYFPADVKISSVFGGVSINPQMMELRGGADVVVATPGRLLDLIRHNALRLDGIKTLVLDEADRLLALGFAQELGEILALLPTHRQSLLFSATFPPEVQTLADELLRTPVRINIEGSDSTTPDIVQRAIAVDADKRTQLLRSLIQSNEWTRVLVFVATKYSTEHVARKLRRLDISAVALHGELSQGARTQALADFKASKVRVLVATDVAARGLDIVQLPVVVNYDLPRSPVDYVHRIGRTGRAGETGMAISFVSAATEMHFRLIEKRQRMRLAREKIEGFEPASVHEWPSSNAGTDKREDEGA